MSTYESHDEGSKLEKYLTFVLGSEHYGLETDHVREIIGMQPITSLPDVPPWVRGVINLRGKVIPVMDVRIRFGLPERSYDARTCIIVVNVKGWWVGLVVDTVSEVVDISPDQIEPPPQVAVGATEHFIKGLGKAGDTVRLLLDAPRVLGAEPQGLAEV